jgi:4'-phosphopantetheinyl transferase
MPLILHSNVGHTVKIAVWKTEEDNSYFLDHLVLFEEEIAEISTLSERKRAEWLSSRYLLHLLTESNERLACAKDNFGKPYLIGLDKHVSLSHSGIYAAAILATESTGIDIQIRTENIHKIKHKFLSEHELNHISQWDTDKLLVAWGTKECLFKAYSKGSVDFRKDLWIEDFVMPTALEKSGSLIAGVNKENFVKKYALQFIVSHTYVLVYIVNEVR